VRVKMVFEIGFGIAKGHAMLLEQLLVNLEAALKLKEAPNLSLRWRTSPRRLNGDRLERAPRNIVPPPPGAAETSSGRSIVTFRVTAESRGS
jgi:hypothetical protein